jgi:hypothetical protein
MSPQHDVHNDLGIPNRFERKILPRGQQLDFQAAFTLSRVAEV